VYFKELMVMRHCSMCGNIYKKCIPPQPLKTTCTIPGIPCYLRRQGQNVSPLNFGTDPISVQGWQVHVYTPKCMISWFSVNTHGSLRVKLAKRWLWQWQWDFTLGECMHGHGGTSWEPWRSFKPVWESFLLLWATMSELALGGSSNYTKTPFCSLWGSNLCFEQIYP
jgi:hypothetical protein